MTSRWLNEIQQGWKWFSETTSTNFYDLKLFVRARTIQYWLVSARAQLAQGERDGKRLDESPMRWMTVCCLLRMRRVSQALLHLCVLWSRILQAQMEDLNNASPRPTAGGQTSSAHIHQSDVRFQRGVAPVSSPALPAARLTLPGVMDAEGRVDESRLRMHIFKNGRSAIYLLHTLWLLASLSDFPQHHDKGQTEILNNPINHIKMYKIFANPKDY